MERAGADAKQGAGERLNSVDGSRRSSVVSNEKIMDSLETTIEKISTTDDAVNVSENIQNQSVDAQVKDSIEIEDNNIIMLIGNIVNKIADNS